MVTDSKNLIVKLTSLLVCLVFSLQLASCGTLLYPERRGQRGGQMDVAVVLLDAIGLLFFLIPGVIAFAVDLSTGAIYLPPGQSHGRVRISDSGGEPNVIHVAPELLNPDTLSGIVAANTGQPIRLDDSRLIIEKADKSVDVAAELSRLSRLYVR